MLLLLSGIVIGLLLNPVLESQFAGVAVIPFVLFNLLLAAGLRNQIERWMARRRVRELIVLVIVLLAALPQLLAVTGVPASVRRLLLINTGAFFPWSATAEISLGRHTATNWAVLLAWTVGAYFFGRWQFERSLRFDMAAAQSEDRAPVQSGSWLDRLYRLPSLVFPDPLAAVIEKELRSLSRTPRFRLVFIMGFTFGVIVFLPIVLRGGSGTSSDYLALVSAYALLLLGDVAFWNVFGFDRGAAQLYFLLPVPISRVMIGKNLAASFFIVLEITAITAIWILIRMPVSLGKIVESYASVMIFSVYLIGAGNLSSIYYPRAVNPEKSTGAGSAGRIRALLLFIYPVAAIPVLLAYGARYAFNSQLAFCLVLAFAALAGAGFYWIALDSAITKAEERKEKLLRVLSERAGPVQLS
jgi:ABC-2 type transport system permease protein